MSTPSTFQLKNVAGLVVGLLLGFLLWFWWNSGSHAARPTERPSRLSAGSELDLVEFAVRRARSWRVTTAGTADGQRFQTDQDVFCPDQSHIVTYSKAPSGESTLAEEFIETGGTLYARQGNDAWTSQPSPESKACTSGPQAGPEPMLTLLERIKAHSSIRKGALVQFAGNSCRIWEVLSSDSNSRVGDLCVDDATHLPYEFRQGSLQVQYSNWNQPVLIAAPEIPRSRQLPHP